MALLSPNAIYTACGVTVNEKIIPDGTRWKDATKAVKAGFSANSLYKANKKLSNDTGVVQSVTIHNTNDLDNVHDDAEQYTRATYNENMNSSRVHFYVDDVGAWQNLKAGLGMCSADPIGSAEVSWHSGDGSITTGGNMTSLSIEIIMGDASKNDAKARDNGARLAAFSLYKHGLSIDKLYTHTYWVNKSAGKSFSDPDEQSTNLISGKKWCPTYIFGSSNHDTALKNWRAFKALVKTYLDELNSGKTIYPAPVVNEDPKPTTTTKLSIEEVAKDVYAGKYGNGDARKAALKAAGYTDDEISAIQSRVNELVSGKKTTSAPKPVAKDLDAAAKDVYAGKYGNGDARKAALKAAGYTDDEISAIQQKVNDLIAGKKSTTTTTKPVVENKPIVDTKPIVETKPVAKDLDAAAKDVYAGKYGNGDARKAALKAAGYTDDEISTIQQKVNDLIAGKKSTSAPKPVAKDLDAAARKVIRGDYGNGDVRKTNLKKAGYTDSEISIIQQKVNALLK